MPDQNPTAAPPVTRSTIVVAIWWPDEGSYGIPRLVETLDEAVNVAAEWSRQGYAAGKSRIRIIETTKRITEWQPTTV